VESEAGSDIVEWLLEGNPAVRWRALRHFTGASELHPAIPAVHNGAILDHGLPVIEAAGPGPGQDGERGAVDRSRQRRELRPRRDALKVIWQLRSRVVRIYQFWYTRTHLGSIHHRYTDPLPPNRYAARVTEVPVTDHKLPIRTRVASVASRTAAALFQATGATGR
jgi:hypothetical protein